MNNDNNTFVKNSLYSVIYRVLSVAFPLIMSMYASHIIKASGIGAVASAQNIAQYFTLIAALGIPEYGVREVAKLKDKDKETNLLFSELLSLNAISTICCALAYYIMGALCDWFGNRGLYLIAGILVVFNLFNIDWIYQGKENFKYITIRSFLVKIIALLLLIISVRHEGDYLNYLFVNIISVVGNYILNITNLRKIGVRFIFRDINIVKHLKPVLILLSTTVAIELYTLLDTTMLTIFCMKENVGYYTMALKIPRMIITAVTGISGALLPRLSWYYSKGELDKCNEMINMVLSILSFIFLPCGIGLIIVAPDLVDVFFGKSFLPGVKTFQLSALLIYALGFSNLFGTQTLLTVGCEKKLLLSTIYGAVSNIFLNLILIPELQQNGATIASVVSEMIVTIVTFNFSKKYFEFRIIKKSVVPELIACTLMAIICFIVSKIINIRIISLIVTVLTGIIVYISINMILKNPIIPLTKELIHRK